MNVPHCYVMLTFPIPFNSLTVYVRELTLQLPVTTTYSIHTVSGPTIKYIHTHTQPCGKHGLDAHYEHKSDTQRVKVGLANFNPQDGHIIR
jgi:hypothetical protein